MDYECLMKPALREMPLFPPMTNPRDVTARYGIDSVVRMGANENPFGPSPKAMEAMRSAMASAFQYPDRQAELTQAIAARYGVAPESVVLSGGATGVINLLGDVFVGPCDEVVMSNRVSIGTPAQNERFARAILEIAKSGALAPRAEMAVARA